MVDKGIFLMLKVKLHCNAGITAVCNSVIC